MDDFCILGTDVLELHKGQTFLMDNSIYLHLEV